MRTRPLRLVEPDAVAPVSPLADEHDVLTQREAAALLRMSVSSVIRHGDLIHTDVSDACRDIRVNSCSHGSRGQNESNDQRYRESA